MKKLVNPTTYFFEQAEQVKAQVNPQIQSFVSKLLNKESCELCRLPYDLFDRIPRILIHCGHTFCTPCLQKFYMYINKQCRKNRVRCPMCLKLVKQLESLQRLPINHTIYTYLVEKDIEKCVAKNREPAIKDPSKFLYGQFERVQKQAHRAQNPQKYDDQSGLPFCVFHSDRVEHFYCQSHKSFGCRVCIEIGHSKSDCQVVDLYTVDNPGKYQNILQQRIEEPFNPTSYNEYKKNGDNNIKLGLGCMLDPQLMGDEIESQEGNKSF